MDVTFRTLSLERVISGATAENDRGLLLGPDGLHVRSIFVVRQDSDTNKTRHLYARIHAARCSARALESALPSQISLPARRLATVGPSQARRSQTACTIRRLTAGLYTSWTRQFVSHSVGITSAI